MVSVSISLSIIHNPIVLVWIHHFISKFKSYVLIMSILIALVSYFKSVIDPSI